VAKALYSLDGKAAGIIISTGYITAIVVNLVVGFLVDRFNRLFVLGGIFILLAIASSSMTIENLATFRVATAAVIGLGFTAANQLYGLAGSVTSRGETGNAMGVVSLGAGFVRLLRTPDAGDSSRLDRFLRRGLLHGGHCGRYNVGTHCCSLSHHWRRRHGPAHVR
jgi:hypothetical protein